MSDFLFHHAGNAWINLCVIALLATSLVHSILGERRLIGPLLAQRDGILTHDLARFLLRTVWHFMTILFWIIAAALWASTRSTDFAVSVLLATTAIGVGGAGIYDAIGSRGRHVGWPMLVLIGVFAVMALIAQG
jgi:hypothetical protein